MAATSSHDAAGILNGLIGACHDDMLAQEATAQMVVGDPRRRLNDAVRRRRSFVVELTRLVGEQGGHARKRGTLAQRVRLAITSARVFMGGGHAGDSYCDSAQASGNAERLYDRALKRVLPDDVRAVLTRQHAEIAADHVDLRRRRIL